MIQFSSVSRSFAGHLAVDNVSFEVQEGSIVGLLGPNGAGKSTVMKMMAGLLTPDSGTIKIAGHTLNDSPPHIATLQAIRAQMGYLPEASPTYPEMTVLEYLRLVSALRNLTAKSETIAIAEMLSRLNLTSVIHKPIQNLSRGFRQRVAVAQAMIHRPPILILDEPTNGLDPSQTHDLRDIIRALAIGEEKEVRKPTTIVLSTHILQEVEALCDRVLIMQNGRLVYSGPLKNRQKTTVFEVHIFADDQDDHSLSTTKARMNVALQTLIAEGVVRDITDNPRTPHRFLIPISATDERSFSVRCQQIVERLTVNHLPPHYAARAHESLDSLYKAALEGDFSSLKAVN